jgi:hypothetical protein
MRTLYIALMFGFLMIQTESGLFRIGFDRAYESDFEDGIAITLTNPEIKNGSQCREMPDLPKDRLGNTPVKDVTIRYPENRD